MSKADPPSDPAKGVKDKQARRSPNRPLPTNRIAVGKQIETLRAYAACSEPDGHPVTNSDVGDVVGLTANTVSLANTFFTAAGFLERTENGYIPSQGVRAFYHAYQWNPDTAAHKLAPILVRTWFWGALQGKLGFRPVPEDEAISDLSEVCQAGPEYKQNLRMLLDLLEIAGMVTRENGHLRSASVPAQSAPATERPPSQNGAAGNGGRREAMASGNNAEPDVGFPRGNGGLVDFSINVHVEMTELSRWSPDRIAQFFKGIALVLAAKNDKDIKEIEQLAQ